MQYLSKELITTILGDEKWQKRFELIDPLIEDNVIKYRYDKCTQDYISINIHEFAHRCKEFLKENWLCVWSGNGFNKSVGYECSIAHFMYGDEKTFKADTEAEAIFAATIAVIKGEVDFD